MHIAIIELCMYLCMYVYYIDSPKGCKFFWKVLFFYTHYFLSVPPYQPLLTAIVVVRTPYI